MPTKNTKQIIETLEKLGGREFAEDSLTFEGDKLILPLRKTPEWAIDTIKAHIEAESATHNFDRLFRYRPWDVAAAAARTIKVLTGTSGIGVATRTFFGRTPPSMLSVDIGVGQTMQIPWGNIEVPMFEGTVTLAHQYHDDYGVLGFIRVSAPRRMRSAIEGWFKMIERELVTNSIYRGKAFNGAEQPEFIDLDAVDPAQVIYSDEVEFQLEANVWSLLKHTDAMRENRIPLKRAVLLHGDYGTGKTLAAFLTAQVAVQNAWTFIYCRPGKDDLLSVMQTAKLYQPSVVFFEDVDLIAEGDEGAGVTQLLDTFDGITAKGTALMAILTTNHPQRIHKGMLRSGRLDSVIKIGTGDRSSFRRMIEVTVVPEALAADIDWDAIATEFDGFLPAFVKEAISRTMLYALTRGGGKLGMLETEDFVHAARGLRPQLEMMNEAIEGKPQPELEIALTDTVQRAVHGAKLFNSEYDEQMGYVVVGNGNQ